MTDGFRGETVPRLFSQLNRILGLHLILAAAFVTDAVPFRYANKEIERFFSFDQGIVIASLLVVWTFLTAIVLYYIGKKDERLYGIRNWKIAQQALSCWQKKGIILVFGTVLFLLLLAGMVKLPVTLTALNGLLFVTAGYMLWTVIKMSDEDVLRQELAIQIGVIYDEPARQRIRTELLEDMDYSDPDCLDFWAGILTDCFIKKLGGGQRLEFYELSPAILWIANRTGGGLRGTFLKELAGRVEDRCPEATEFFTAVMIAAMEGEGNPEAELKGVLSVISQERIRNVLIIRALIYNTYIEARMGKACRTPVQKRLQYLLTVPAGAEERVDAMKFWRALYRDNKEIRDSMSLKEAMRWIY